MLLWLVALRYGAFTRKAQRAYQDGLAETNEVMLPIPHTALSSLPSKVLRSFRHTDVSHTDAGQALNPSAEKLLCAGHCPQALPILI